MHSGLREIAIYWIKRCKVDEVAWLAALQGSSLENYCTEARLLREYCLASMRPVTSCPAARISLAEACRCAAAE